MRVGHPELREDTLLKEHVERLTAHRFSDEVREGIRSVGLDLATRSYLLIDAVSLEIDLMPA